MILWGMLTCLMAVIKDFKHLVVLRVIIGCVEAGFAPGVLLVLSSWYKRTEQSKRFGVYISAAILSGAFGGLLAAGIVNGLEGVHGIRGWRWLFIVEGAATVGFAIIALFILPDFPATSRRLSEREKHVAVARLATENVTATTADSERLSNWQAMKISVQDWRTWVFVVGYMVIVGSSTLTYFYPTLIKGLFGHASTYKVNLLTVPIYGFAFVCTAISSYYSDKIPAWRGLVIAGWLTFSLTCSIIVCAVYNFTARYVLLVLMAAGLWATNGGTLAYASSAFAGMNPQARGVSLALVNALGNLAQIYGSVCTLHVFSLEVTNCYSIFSRIPIVRSISWGSRLSPQCWHWELSSLFPCTSGSVVAPDQALKSECSGIPRYTRAYLDFCLGVLYIHEKWICSFTSSKQFGQAQQ